VGKSAVEQVLAGAFIVFGCVGLAGCSPQSNSGFQAVANPSPNAAAVQRQPLQTASVVPASTTNAIAGQPPAPAETLAPTSTAEYRIRSGDVLQINVFQLQDFNREAPVDAAGTIGLPLIGAVPVAGKTVRQVEEEIAQGLKAKYLQNPQVLVTIKDAVGLRVAVQGAVRNPGLFPLHGDTTLTNVIAQANGMNDISDSSQVLIIRNTDQGRVATKVDAGAILSGSASDPQIYGGDTVVVGESFIRNAEREAMTVLGGAATLTVFHGL
jgi:polysaccharide biosynthesis/export protein